MNKNYYEWLEVAPTASLDDIKKSYRRLAKKFHPDVNPGNAEAEAIFKEIATAYQTLSDDASRQAYDEKLARQGSGGGGFAGASASGNKQNRAAASGKVEFDMQQVHQSFESFFGFNPKSKEPKMNSSKETSKNPIDTTELFERYFGGRKR